MEFNYNKSSEITIKWINCKWKLKDYYELGVLSLN